MGKSRRDCGHWDGVGVVRQEDLCGLLVASLCIGSVRVTENRVVKEGTQCLPLSMRTLNTYARTRIPTTMCTA